MISFITGKPGDGKSLFATLRILQTLIDAEVYIVTNVPLRWGAVNAFVTAARARKGIEAPFLIEDRLCTIEDKDCFEFYRFRSGGLVLPLTPDRVSEEDGTKGPKMDKTEFVLWMKTQFLRIRGSVAYQRPVHYYIDEAHTFFDSREWASTGRGLIYYASQHRHLHDEVYFITQVMENVETRLRKLASETHAVRNQLRRRIGPVRMRPVFRVQSFYGVPMGNVKPFAETTFPLDVKGVASCYRTVGALGVHQTPEKIRNSAPFPWWVLPVAGVVAVLALFFALVGLPYLGARGGSKLVHIVQEDGAPVPGLPSSAAKEPVPSPAVDGSPRRVLVGGAARPAAEALTRTAPPPRVEVVGYVVRRSTGGVTVRLSDGRTLTEDDVALLDARYVEDRSGHRYYLAKPVSREHVSVSPVRAPVPVVAMPEVGLEERTEQSWVRGADGVSRLRPEALKDARAVGRAKE